MDRVHFSIVQIARESIVGVYDGVLDYVQEIGLKRKWVWLSWFGLLTVPCICASTYLIELARPPVVEAEEERNVRSLDVTAPNQEAGPARLAEILAD